MSLTNTVVIPPPFPFYPLSNPWECEDFRISDSNEPISRLHVARKIIPPPSPTSAAKQTVSDPFFLTNTGRI